MSHKAMRESERGEINREGKEGQRSAIEAGEGLRSTIEASGIIGGSFIEKVLHTANGEESKIDGGKKKKISQKKKNATLAVTPTCEYERIRASNIAERMELFRKLNIEEALAEAKKRSL